MSPGLRTVFRRPAAGARAPQEPALAPQSGRHARRPDMLCCRKAWFSRPKPQAWPDLGQGAADRQDDRSRGESCAIPAWFQLLV